MPESMGLLYYKVDLCMLHDSMVVDPSRLRREERRLVFGEFTRLQSARLVYGGEKSSMEGETHVENISFDGGTKL